MGIKKEGLPKSFLEKIDPGDLEDLLPKPAPPLITVEDAAVIDEREAQVHSKIIRWVKKVKIRYLHADTRKKSTLPIGYPDFTFFMFSGVVFIEVKLPGNKLTIEQEDWKAYLEKCGPYYIVSSKEEVEMLLTRHLKFFLPDLN